MQVAIGTKCNAQPGIRGAAHQDVAPMAGAVHPAFGHGLRRGIALRHVFGNLAVIISGTGGAVGQIASIAAVVAHPIAGGAVTGMGLCGLLQAGVLLQGGKSLGLPFRIDRGQAVLDKGLRSLWQAAGGGRVRQGEGEGKGKKKSEHRDTFTGAGWVQDSREPMGRRCPLAMRLSKRQGHAERGENGASGGAGIFKIMGDEKGGNARRAGAFEGKAADLRAQFGIKP